MAGPGGGAIRAVRFDLLSGLLVVAAVAAIAACSSPPRDLDMMVWSHSKWDPRQEQRDYAECYQHAKRAAYRKFHWRRTALSREIEQPTGAMSPATIMVKLQEIAEDEKIATFGIAEQCMEDLGYKLLPINKTR